MDAERDTRAGACRVAKRASDPETFVVGGPETFVVGGFETFVVDGFETFVFGAKKKSSRTARSAFVSTGSPSAVPVPCVDTPETANAVA